MDKSKLVTIPGFLFGYKESGKTGVITFIKPINNKLKRLTKEDIRKYRNSAYDYLVP